MQADIAEIWLLDPDSQHMQISAHCIRLGASQEPLAAEMQGEEGVSGSNIVQQATPDLSATSRCAAPDTGAA